MGEGKMQIYLGSDDEISDNTNIELAIDKDLIAEDSLDKGFSDKEADSILDKFDDLYYGEFWPDNIENVYSIIRATRFQRKSVRIWAMAHFHWKTQRLKISLIL